MGDPVSMQVVGPARPYLPVVLLVCSLSLWALACTGPLQQRTLYQNDGFRIGLETDATPNEHPGSLTPQQVRTLLAALQVSGWSGAIGGLLVSPTPIPVFSEPELNLISGPIAEALRHATARERVTFHLPKPGALYSKDSTAGALFLRNGYLHLTLSDHYAFLAADPGGGEERDPRDTKGMQLFVTPAKAASVPKDKEPDWGAF